MFKNKQKEKPSRRNGRAFTKENKNENNQCFFQNI